MCFTFALTTFGFSQQWQTVFYLDTRVGYSTNSYLNPFLSEWDATVESGYNFTSVIGQASWYNNGHSLSIMGGPLYMPVFNKQQDNWGGGLGLINYNYWLSDKISAGFEGGASYMKGAYSRTLLWAQPQLTWFISPFTLFRAKAGSNFRNYRNYSGISQTRDRLDLYSLEFETWPSYRWRLRTALHGELDAFPDIREGFNSQASVSYFLRNGASITMSGSWAQYQYESTTTGDNGTTPFPPGNDQTPSTISVTNVDRIINLGVEGSFPVNKQFTLFAGVTGVQLRPESESSGEVVTEFKVSGGLRFSFNPDFRTKDYSISPEWKKTKIEQEVRIRYPGEGQLYLVGNFNNWNKSGIPLTESTDNLFTAQLLLETGAYEYKVLKVEGSSEDWLPFSNEVYTVDDGFGSENAMLLVE